MPSVLKALATVLVKVEDKHRLLARFAVAPTDFSSTIETLDQVHSSESNISGLKHMVYKAF